MAVAKVISNDGENVKLGFEDGSFREVRAKDIGFLAPVDKTIDVYESEVDGEKKYEYVEHKVVAMLSDKKKVSKTTYCVLAFFFCFIGAHKFYSGKVALGVVYLVFCWTFIPALVAFVEFIIGLTKTADEDGMITV